MLYQTLAVQRDCRRWRWRRASSLPREEKEDRLQPGFYAQLTAGALLTAYGAWVWTDMLAADSIHMSPIAVAIGFGFVLLVFRADQKTVEWPVGLTSVVGRAKVLAAEQPWRGIALFLVIVSAVAIWRVSQAQLSIASAATFLGGTVVLVSTLTLARLLVSLFSRRPVQ